MEMNVPLNEILRDDITKISHTLLPPGFHGDSHRIRVVRDTLSRLIDSLGEQSASAQGLNKVITTAEKLTKSTVQTLYVLKDKNAKGGNGDLIGLLKVGWKHLYLFDERDTVREVEPMCVLDFFVRADYQRHGYGKKLFDHMLKEERVQASQLAIDGPSSKMEQFMRKNYGIDRLIRQSNNFAVAPQFFAPGGADLSLSGRSTPVSVAHYGRFAAPKPSSGIANVIHGGGNTGSCENKPSRHASRAATPDFDKVVSPAEPPAKREVEKPVPEPETSKVEELKVEISPERPTTLQVETLETPLPPATPALSPAGSTLSRRDSQLTERGYFDVKFYHNKLW